MNRVLIVDDKEENTYYLQALLSGHGFAVDVARHGAEALVKARQSPPDLIISDLLMPVIDGYTLLRLLKADERLKGILFIVYTATYTEPEDEVLALRLGADAFILKPTEPEDFLNRIRQVQANRESGQVPLPASKPGDDQELLKVYSETLIRKLEEKTVQLEATNRALLRDITERREAEEKLRERESLLSSAQSIGQMGSWILDLRSRRLLWSDITCLLFGVKPGDFAETYEAYCQFILPEDLAMVNARNQLASLEQPLVEVDYRIRRADGQIRWMFERGTVEFDAHGQQIRRLGLVMDVTERRRADEELRLLNYAVKQAKEAVMITEPVLDWPGPRIIFVNPAFTEMTGYTAAEVIGRTPRIFQGPRTDRSVLDRLRRNLERGETFHGKTINYRKGGQEYILEWQVTPLRATEGHITHFLAIQRDVTERERAEEELRWKTAFLEAQVDCSLDGILVVDTQGRKILQNQRMADLWKIPPEIASDQDDSVQLEFAASRTKNPWQFKAGVRQLNTTPFAVSREEIELVDGTVLDRYSSPVCDQSGKCYGRIWAFRDITQQRKLEAQYRQSQKMEAFGQLAGGVAHDFNNILAVIQLQAGMLKLDPGLSLQQVDFASEIERASRRAADLTRQLLLFSRQQAMQARDLDLRDVVHEIAKMLQRTLGEHIELRFELPGEPILIHADPGMMDQILLNLTVNARDAMAKGGLITIAVNEVEIAESTAAQIPQARAGRFVCLRVSDTGCGIPEEIMPRIFEPFFTTKQTGKGTGLGLATVFGIVQQHQGWIQVESKLNQGTSFRIFLPRLNTGNEKPVAWEPLSYLRGGQETILFVEDELSLSEAVGMVLSRLGYRVLKASNGPEALQLWKQHRDEIQLVLTDLVMPGGITGTELASELLRMDPKLKIVFASGYSSEIAGSELFSEEAGNFLRKPFDASLLAQTIRANLDRKEPPA